MKSLKLSLLFSLVATSFAAAATGTFGSGLTFVTSSTESTPIASGDRSSSSAATDLGDFGLGAGNTLNLTGAGILTWKNSGGDVTDAKFNYRVYLVGADPKPDFTAVDLDFGANHTFSEYGITSGNFGDQMWGDSDTYGSGFTTIDLLNGRAEGTYALEWFLKAVTNEGDRFENNSNANFIANFTVVPEPSAALLGGIGMLALLRRRRA